LVQIRGSWQSAEGWIQVKSAGAFADACAGGQSGFSGTGKNGSRAFNDREGQDISRQTVAPAHWKQRKQQDGDQRACG